MFPAHKVSGYQAEKQKPSIKVLTQTPNIPEEATSLVESVTTVNDDVGTSHEAGSVRSEEDAETIEVVDGTQALLGSERLPDLLLGIKGGNLVKGGIHVAGGDAVDTDVVLGPLSGEGLAELDDTGLGGVVAGLLLRVVDDGAGHRSNEDDGAGLASGHHGAANSLGHQERTVEVDVDETTEHGGVVLLSRNVGVGNTGRVNEDVRGAIKVNDVLNGSIDGVTITNVHLEERDRKAGLLVKLGSRLVAKLLVGIKDGNGLRASLSAGASHVVTKTTGTTVNLLVNDLRIVIWSKKDSLPSDDDDLTHDAHLLESARHLTIDLVLQGLDMLVGLAILNRLARLDGDAEVIASVAGRGTLCVGRVDGDRDLGLLDDLRLEVANGNRESGALSDRSLLAKESRRAGKGGKARGHADGASSGGHFDDLFWW